MALSRLIYASRATGSVSKDELIELTRKAAKNNSALDLSGALVFSKGCFLQMLEGPEATVLKLFAKIAKDPRHCDVQQLSFRPILSRAFSGWGMSFLYEQDTFNFDRGRIAGILARLQGAPCLEELGDSALLMLEEMKTAIIESTRLADTRQAA
jgi:hypothetical protein